MENQFVFQEEKEIERLHVQNSLLSCYEAPIFEELFSRRHGLAVLDVGCNNGSKTVERFAADCVSQVIGLEYSPELAVKAQETYGNDQFSFYPFDVEAPAFSQRLQAIMDERGVDGFDVIYLSYVLMHLSDIGKLLESLRPFLNEQGQLLIIDSNDGASSLSLDPDGLLDQFLEILRDDRYSGNRETGSMVCQLLRDSGAWDVHIWHNCISAGPGEAEKKKAIFTTFFSYLPEDVALLMSEEPENETYHGWDLWIREHYPALKDRIMQNETVISMGIKILTCTKSQ